MTQRTLLISMEGEGPGVVDRFRRITPAKLQEWIWGLDEKTLANSDAFKSAFLDWFVPGKEGDGTHDADEPLEREARQGDGLPVDRRL